MKTFIYRCFGCERRISFGAWCVVCRPTDRAFSETQKT